jgi:hypothetical protein
MQASSIEVHVSALVSAASEEQKTLWNFYTREITDTTFPDTSLYTERQYCRIGLQRKFDNEPADHKVVSSCRVNIRQA